MPFDLLLFFNLVFIFIWYLNLLCLTLLPISYVVGISITTDHWRKNKACFLHYLVPCSVVTYLYFGDLFLAVPGWQSCMMRAFRAMILSSRLVGVGNVPPYRSIYCFAVFILFLYVITSSSSTAHNISWPSIIIPINWSLTMSWTS